MTETETISNRQQQLRMIRQGLAIIGIAIFALAVLADPLGLSDGSSFGTGQVMGVILGIIILTIAILWQHTLKVYQITAILMLNTLVLLAIIEFSLIGVERVSMWLEARQHTAVTDTQTTGNPLQEANQMALHWREFDESRVFRYEPYTIWRRNAYEGETINVDENGLRDTPGSQCDDDAYTVYVFGGSTVWGTGAVDSETIPAYLQQHFDTLHDAVCVVNFGETAYVATQGTIILMLQLQAGQIPDLVVFYNGLNEVFAGYQNNDAFTHMNLESISAIFDGTDNQEEEETSFFADLHITKFIRSMIPEPSQSRGKEVMGANLEAIQLDDTLPADIVASYISNYQMVQMMAETYGFDYQFFWQPLTLVEDKPMTEQEIEFRDNQPDNLKQLYQETYALMQAEADNYPHLYYIADVFNGESDSIYVDWMHPNGQGNEMVAQTMIERINTEQDGAGE